MKKSPAFTLVELLVVIAVVGILAALAFPFASRSIKKSQETSCLQNLRQLGGAFLAYQGENQFRLPPKQVPLNEAEDWVVSLLPYISNDKKVLLCPANPVKFRSVNFPADFFTNYGINYWIRDYQITKSNPLSLPRLSATVMLVDSNKNWLKDIQPDRVAFVHGNSANLLYMDGHVGTSTREQLIGTDGKMAAFSNPLNFK
jgi:prepilin-type N-terminal cleavage/methylation domain-containing protein/prepilin-type processing-associated H-X9-DG protein